MAIATIRRKLEIDPRYIRQNALVAVRDIFDALTELITNSDDAYARGNARHGEIEIEIERRRKDAPSVIKVRDFAGGFIHGDMERKLGRYGDRHNSGMAEGANVRGTNSRGAKDVAALGSVTFESIANGFYSHARIQNGEFELWPQVKANPKTRRLLGIPNGSGTLVTIEVDPTHAAIPQHDKMVKKLSWLVPLRDILADPDREVTLKDLNKDRTDVIRYIEVDGDLLVDDSFTIPGYPKCEVRLSIRRCKKFLENRMKFRQGGILIKSRKAIHEATLFAPEYEHDPIAGRFFGRLTCGYIDDLWNEADMRMEKGLSPVPTNPFPILDPMRQAGLRRDHPVFEALQHEVLKRLRPLVEQEQQREAAERAQIENRETRRKLNELERLATKFMQEQQESDEIEEDNPTDGPQVNRKVRDAVITPPYCQMIVGQSRRFSLVINQAKYPELAVGGAVQIHCETGDIHADRLSCPLECHPTNDGSLRASWNVTAISPTSTTGIRVTAGGVVKQALVEVVASERELYTDINDLQFWRKRYRLHLNQAKRIRLVAPSPAVIANPETVTFSCNSDSVSIGGDREMVICDNLGIAECWVTVKIRRPINKAILIADVAGKQAQTELVDAAPESNAIKISLEDIDYKNQRYRWERGTNKLSIAGRHPSVRRYLGPPPEFLGQDRTQFQVLLAEIVAFAVCEKVLTRNFEQNPDDYRDADFDTFIAERDALVSRFLPAAHESQVPKPMGLR